MTALSKVQYPILSFHNVQPFWVIIIVSLVITIVTSNFGNGDVQKYFSKETLLIA